VNEKAMTHWRAVAPKTDKQDVGRGTVYFEDSCTVLNDSLLPGAGPTDYCLCLLLRVSVLHSPGLASCFIVSDIFLRHAQSFSVCVMNPNTADILQWRFEMKRV
jgi:hypothetical protein